MKTQIASPGREIVEELHTTLTKIYGERLRDIVLYGSWARGGGTEESDIDVLVVLEDLTSYDDELRRISRIAARLTLEHGIYVSAQPISERDLQERSEPFLTNVRREGIRLA